jgi:hypothetical protein
MYAALFSILFLLVGLLIGVVFNERYREHVNWNKHEFDKLFRENPHPECFDKKGHLIKEDYLNVDFALDYDPSTDHMGPGEFGEDDDDMDFVYSDD